MSARPPVPRDVATGTALKWARRLRGVARSELGDALGVKARTMGAIEAGQRRLRPDELATAARLLDVPEEWLRNPLPDTFEVVDVELEEEE